MSLVAGTAQVIRSPLISNEHGVNSDVKNKASERYGLTNQEADELRVEWGFNELPSIHIPLWWIFFVQFTGTMPYVKFPV